MLSIAVYAAIVTSQKTADLAGAWNTQVQFKTGSFSSVKDLEFLLVFNKGGTMVESSNYDAAPPVPPAYGIWRKTGNNRFEAKYVFYVTKPPEKFEEIKSGMGWMPAGRGELLEKITLASDGKSYRSTLTMKMFDVKGKLGEVSTASCRGVRMKF